MTGWSGHVEGIVSEPVVRPPPGMIVSDVFFFSSRRRHTRFDCDWSSDVCSSDLVVREGTLFTGGGVTAGIDMALTVMAEIAGQDLAEAVQLAIEYSPDPPFDCG